MASEAEWKRAAVADELTPAHLFLHDEKRLGIGLIHPEHDQQFYALVLSRDATAQQHYTAWPGVKEPRLKAMPYTLLSGDFSCSPAEPTSRRGWIAWASWIASVRASAINHANALALSLSKTNYHTPADAQYSQAAAAWWFWVAVQTISGVEVDAKAMKTLHQQLLEHFFRADMFIDVTPSVEWKSAWFARNWFLCLQRDSSLNINDLKDAAMRYMIQERKQKMFTLGDLGALEELAKQKAKARKRPRISDGGTHDKHRAESKRANRIRASGTRSRTVVGSESMRKMLEEMVSTSKQLLDQKGVSRVVTVFEGRAQAEKRSLQFNPEYTLVLKGKQAKQLKGALSQNSRHALLPEFSSLDLRPGQSVANASADNNKFLYITPISGYELKHL